MKRTIHLDKMEETDEKLLLEGAKKILDELCHREHKKVELAIDQNLDRYKSLHQHRYADLTIAKQAVLSLPLL